MKIQKLLTTWVPTILAIIYIVFIALLSLDAFRVGVSFSQKIGGFIIENIPTVLLLITLFWTRQKPRAGGVMFIAVSIIFTLFFRTYQRLDAFILISVPLLVIGGLFLLNKESKKIN